MNTVSIVDSDGNTYTRTVPVHDGEAFYSVDKQGYVIIVARFKPPAPEFVTAHEGPHIEGHDPSSVVFTLSPEEPTEGEIALRKALDEFTD